MATARENALAYLKSQGYSDSQIKDATANIQKQLDSGKTGQQIISENRSNPSALFGGESPMYGSSSSSSSSSTRSSSSSSSYSSSSSRSSSSSSSNKNATDPYGDISGGNKGVGPMDFSGTSGELDESTLKFGTNAHAEQAKNNSYLTNRNNDIAAYLYKQGVYDDNKDVLQSKVLEYLSKFQDFNDAEDWEQANTKRAIADRLSAIAKQEEDKKNLGDISDSLKDINADGKIDKEGYYKDKDGNYFKIYGYDGLSDEEKNLLDRLDDSKKKEVSNMGAQALQEYLRQYDSTMRTKEQAEARQKNAEELYDINRESSLIQARQTLRHAEQSYDNLKQNWQYLGNMGMPGMSATKIAAIGDALTEAKTTLGEVERLTQLSLDAQEKQWQGQVLQYNQQIDNLMYDLRWKIGQEAIDALSKYTSAELEGKLDTIDGITAFRRELLDELDNNLSGITSASLNQMQYINQQYQDVANKMYEYNQNANVVNKDMSAVKGFYVDGNGNPILNNMGQPIEVPQSAPMEPIFDKETGKLITFALDENGQIVANVQQLWNNTNSDAALTQYGIVSMLEQGYSIGDILKKYPNASYKDVEALSKVVTQTMDKNGYSLTWQGGNYNAVDQSTMENAYKDFTSQYATINKNGKFVLKSDNQWGGQCGHFVNNYLQKMGISRLFTDPITDKIKNINSQEAKQGNVIVMDSPTSPQYGHVGIITSVNPQTGDMWIMQSNKDGSEKVFFSKKNINDSDIHGFFDPTKSIQDYNSQRQVEATGGTASTTSVGAGGYKDGYVPDYTNFLKSGTKGFSNGQREDLAKIFGSWENFVANAEAYKTQIDHQVTDTAMQMVDNMADVLSYLNRDSMNIWKLRAGLPYTEGGEMKSKFNQILSSDALQKLIDLKADGATFGALSDNELGFITDAANWFSLTSTEEGLKKEITKKMNKILEKAGMTKEQYYARRGWNIGQGGQPELAATDSEEGW